MWDVGFEIWDLGFGIWDVGCETWDLRCETWDVRRGTADRDATNGGLRFSKRVGFLMGTLDVGSRISDC
jgi:hypothetical protein